MFLVGVIESGFDEGDVEAFRRFGVVVVCCAVQFYCLDIVLESMELGITEVRVCNAK